MPSENIKVLIPRLPGADALLPYLARIDSARTYSNYGPLHREFSTRLSQLAGAPGVTLTCNGTSAIELALRIRARPGRRYCLMPAFTFIASAHAVCNAGLTPYLLDVSEQDMMLTPEIVEAALPLLTEPPAAVLVVSAFGAPPDLIRWKAFEAKHEIPVVFDAAAAVTALNGVGAQPVCVSLHATKVVGIGEGGAIFSSDSDLIERTTAMTGFGFLGAERVSAIRGGNYRISEYAAAIGMAVLDALPARLDALRTLTNSYLERLKTKNVRVQRGVGDEWVTMTFNVVVPPEALQATLDRLDAQGVEWRRWWGLGCHRHPAFADAPRCDMPTTEALAPRVIGLPFHDRLSEQDLDRIADCLP
ncbi:DegT/DnrJ/EryC1/StrS family aminotransferase [Paraburkholderia sp. LEh10]|uniref:DegT/DnrJ/EryC1/StrS family aminotransferase n=1 Tax=Paraburkholderia sp. LEh10 TaxID=2821353 RepID=UPI001AE27F18|nr:DegT/DnrJ/EryC1/StrS family aminotransferase [Paraburkholderia sp. LEh10]MBP0593887.1 DegT/DnrJ/EryC1/StrS family aminotransferase [Paraburkholderia sp. LEh10]